MSRERRTGLDDYARSRTRAAKAAVKRSPRPHERLQLTCKLSAGSEILGEWAHWLVDVDHDKIRETLCTMLAERIAEQVEAAVRRRR